MFKFLKRRQLQQRPPRPPLNLSVAHLMVSIPWELAVAATTYA